MEFRVRFRVEDVGGAITKGLEVEGVAVAVSISTKFWGFFFGMSSGLERFSGFASPSLLETFRVAVIGLGLQSLGLYRRA